MNRGVGRPVIQIAALFTVLATIALGCTSGDSDSGDAGSDGAGGPLEVEVISSRADMVTGGDTLISVNSSEVETVSVDGTESDVGFDTDAGVSVGLVDGLPEGESTIEVKAGGESASVTVVSHPTSGPIFSGDRLPMEICTTENFGLAESSPPECFAESKVLHGYIDMDNEIVEIESISDIPADAVAVEIDGEEQPAVVRVERGVLNRAVYEIISLDTSSGLSSDFDADLWNDRLVYRFGGGCGTTFGQGFMMMGAPDTDLLADGYAFASSTLNTFQVQCNDILSAESAAVVKEHFIKNYGLPVVTIGDGGSGGAIQQTLIAQNYPGILDAIGPTVPFPDAASIAPGVTDCALLSNYYGSEEAAGLTAEQKTAIAGHLTSFTCLAWEQTFVPVIDPAHCAFGDAAAGVASSIPGLENGIPVPPDEDLYNPETNPEGVRCTFQDSYVNVYGTDDAGFANRPLDNAGVQYGLQALNDGVVSFDEFASLNEKVGGFDIDGGIVPERMDVDPAVVEQTYATGRVAQTDTPLNDIPIIAVNVYADPDGDIHDRFRMFSLNERLLTPDGDQAPNYVMWTRAPQPDSSLIDQFSGNTGIAALLTRTLDQWATGIKSDTSDATITEKIEASRPEAAENTCFDPDGVVEDSGPNVYDEPGPCSDPYPVMGDPRTVAGAPLANDIGKCTLQSVPAAVEAGVYETPPSDDEIAKLEAIFPDGVCDWSVPGVGQVQTETTWRSYN